MEEDRGSPAHMLSPSVPEAAAEDAGDRLTSTVDSPQKISAAPEHHYEAEEDDDDDTSEDFEFAFVIQDPESSPVITADEIFSNGQIRSAYPVFNRDLLLADGRGSADGGEAVEEKAVRLPLRRLLIEERNASSRSASTSSSLETDELEGIDPGTYCVWRPGSGSASPSPARCKKSSSTGSSFRWRIRDLVRRSRSDGKEKFVFLAAEEKKPSRLSEKKKNEGEAAAKGEGEGEKRRGEKKGGEVTEVDMVTANRIYYRSRKGEGQTAKGGWRSFLPYKPDLVGFPANVNKLSPAHHPY